MLNVALAQELASLATHYNRTWCYPSRETLLMRLRRFHGQNISLRTLTRHLSALEAAGWIRRQCRHHQDPLLGWQFRSTLYIILGPTIRAIRRLAKTAAKFCGFSRGPSLAHNVNTTCYKSSPGSPTGPPGERKKGSATEFVAEARKILAR